jgi:hypothetical protein
MMLLSEDQNICCGHTSLAKRGRLALGRLILLAVVVAASEIMVPAGAFAQFPGREFYQPFIPEDIYPGNQLGILQPQWEKTSDGRVLSLSFLFSNALSDQTQLILRDEWNFTYPRSGPKHRGFGDLEALISYMFLYSPKHEIALGAGIDGLLPWGDRQTGGSSHYRLGPAILWDVGAGDIPDDGWLRYLRPAYMEGETDFAFEISGARQRMPESNVAIGYSLEYLDKHELKLNLPTQLLHLVPFMEINYAQVTGGLEGRTPPDWYLLPGLAYLTKYYQISVGTQIALTRDANYQSHALVLGLVDIFYDEIIPATKQKLIGPGPMLTW